MDNLHGFMIGNKVIWYNSLYMMMNYSSSSQKLHGACWGGERATLKSRGVTVTAPPCSNVLLPMKRHFQALKILFRHFRHFYYALIMADIDID